MLERIIERVDFGDALIILIVVFATVSFWRGVWGLMDVYLFPTKRILSLAVSVIISLIILFAISMYKGNRRKRSKK